MQDVHSHQYRLFLAAKAEAGKVSTNKRRHEKDDDDDNSLKITNSIQPRQLPVDLALQSRSILKRSQAEFENQLVLMFVEDMQPIAAVERGGFQKFCKMFLPSYSVPSRRTLSRRLNNIYEDEKIKFIELLNKTQWVSTTADIWTGHKRSYMGVTVHFVDPKSLKMVSSVLVCRRFKGSHTGKEIGKMLASIFSEFNIKTKIQNVVTDNAVNFAKAFKLFPQTTTSENDDNTASMFDNNELTYTNVGELLETVSDDENGDPITLPRHKKCGNHSLNLVASSDANNALKDKQYQKLYNKAMAKVQALSNAVTRSSRMSDIVEEMTGKTILQPTITRWNSEYFSVERIVEIGFQKIVDCQKALGLTQMSQSDMLFLAEYLIVMKPIVRAMKLIEGDTDCYLAHLIPTIMGLEKMLQKMNLPLMQPLINALIAGLQARFSIMRNDNDYKIATMLHPKFKMAFLSEEERIRHREILLSYIITVHNEVSPSSLILTANDSQDVANNEINDEDFYSFISEAQDNSNSIVEDQLAGYLASKGDAVNILLAYPAIVDAFRKINSTLPSSASVERLFSAAAQVLSPRRCQLSDDNFDHLVFLRSCLHLT